MKNKILRKYKERSTIYIYCIYKRKKIYWNKEKFEETKENMNIKRKGSTSTAYILLYLFYYKLW
jgi:hypothetical protein